MTAVDRATDPQPAVRPVPRSGRTVAAYVSKMSDRVQYRYDFGFVAVHVSLVVGYYEVCLIPLWGTMRTS